MDLDVEKKAREIRPTFCGAISYLARRHSDTRLSDKGGQAEHEAEGPTEGDNEGSGGAVGGSHFLQELSGQGEKRCRFRQCRRR